MSSQFAERVAVEVRVVWLFVEEFGAVGEEVSGEQTAAPITDVYRYPVQ